MAVVVGQTVLESGRASSGARRRFIANRLILARQWFARNLDAGGEGGCCSGLAWMGVARANVEIPSAVAARRIESPGPLEILGSELAAAVQGRDLAQGTPEPGICRLLAKILAGKKKSMDSALPSRAKSSTLQFLRRRRSPNLLSPIFHSLRRLSFLPRAIQLLQNYEFSTADPEARARWPIEGIGAAELPLHSPFAVPFPVLEDNTAQHL